MGGVLGLHEGQAAVAGGQGRLEPLELAQGHAPRLQVVGDAGPGPRPEGGQQAGGRRQQVQGLRRLAILDGQGAAPAEDVGQERPGGGVLGGGGDRGLGRPQERVGAGVAAAVVLVDAELVAGAGQGHRAIGGHDALQGLGQEHRSFLVQPERVVEPAHGRRERAAQGGVGELLEALAATAQDPLGDLVAGTAQGGVGIVEEVEDELAGLARALRLGAGQGLGLAGAQQGQAGAEQPADQQHQDQGAGAQGEAVPAHELAGAVGAARRRGGHRLAGEPAGEVVGEVLGALVALVGVAGEGAAADPVQLAVHQRVVVAGRRRVAVEEGGAQLGQALAHELLAGMRQGAAGQLVEHHADGVGVAPGVHQLGLQLGLLGGHVLRRAQELAGQGAPGVQPLETLHDLGDAEVDDAHHRAAVHQRDQEVGGLEVTVQDPALVGVVDAGADLAHQGHPLAQRRRVLLRPAIHRAAVDVLHGQPGVVAILAGVVDHRHVGVPQARQDPALGLEALEEAAAAGDALDRHRPVQLSRLLGQEDLAHAPASEAGRHPVGPDGWRRVLGGGVERLVEDPVLRRSGEHGAHLVAQVGVEAAQGLLAGGALESQQGEVGGAQSLVAGPGHGLGPAGGGRPDRQERTRTLGDAPRRARPALAGRAGRRWDRPDAAGRATGPRRSRGTRGSLRGRSGASRSSAGRPGRGGRRPHRRR